MRSISSSLQPRRNDAACRSRDRGDVARRRIGDDRRTRRREHVEQPSHRRGTSDGGLRMGFGGAKIKRLGGDSCCIRAGAEARDPVDVGRASFVDLRRLRRILRPELSHHRGARSRPNAPMRRRRHARPRPAAPCAATAARGRRHRTAEIDMAVAAVDRGGDRRRRIGGDIRRGQRRQRRYADDGLAGGESNAARSRNADPKSGEAAGSDGDRDPVERGK